MAEKSHSIVHNHLDTHPQYARADEVLFFLGSTYAEIKQPDKAVRQFVRLTQQYNTSRYIADAYVSIGEYYFDRNNAFKALQAYKEPQLIKIVHSMVLLCTNNLEVLLQCSEYMEMLLNT